MTRLPRPVAIVTLLALAACAPWMKASTGADNRPVGIPGVGGTASAGQSQLGSNESVSRKVVKGKREPVTLIADDKTECIVPESKWKETSVGEKAACAWRAP